MQDVELGCFFTGLTGAVVFTQKTIQSRSSSVCCVVRWPPLAVLWLVTFHFLFEYRCFVSKDRKRKVKSEDKTRL